MIISLAPYTFPLNKVVKEHLSAGSSRCFACVRRPAVCGRGSLRYVRRSCTFMSGRDKPRKLAGMKTAAGPELLSSHNNRPVFTPAVQTTGRRRAADPPINHRERAPAANTVPPPVCPLRPVRRSNAEEMLSLIKQQGSMAVRRALCSSAALQNINKAGEP